MNIYDDPPRRLDNTNLNSNDITRNHLIHNLVGSYVIKKENHGYTSFTGFNARRDYGIYTPPLNPVEKEFSNFHLVAEFKWGVKKYPPRDADTTRRDNGILYFVPLNARDFVWPKGIECQIQEGDTGDFWMIDSATIVIDGIRTTPKDFSRSIKKKDAEKPTGEWNRVEVISNKGKITHIVNGTIVNECTGASLTKGKIIIQSEGAEIFYRKIEIAETN